MKLSLLSASTSSSKELLVKQLAKKDKPGDDNSPSAQALQYTIYNPAD